MGNEDIILEEEISEEPTVEPTEVPTIEPSLIYFDNEKKAYGYEIEDALCTVEKDIWQEFSTLTLGVDYDVTEDGIVDLRPPIDVRELEKAKQDKLKENDTKRDIALNAGVVYKDVLFDSDTDQKVNLLAIVSTMDDEQTIVWFGKDNQPLECDKADLINIGGLITQLHSFCWNKNAEIKSAIGKAKTMKALEKVVIDYDNTDSAE